jgi:hypothetical protein
MKRPENFEKVDDWKFPLFGTTFYTQVDKQQNKENHSWLWVFCNGSILGDYAILFELKWEHECFSMKKCVLGEGTTGEYIFQDNLLERHKVKTKDAFTDYIVAVIAKAVGLKHFAN